jgi:spermidine/putrescine transport system permease protein
VATTLSASKARRGSTATRLSRWVSDRIVLLIGIAVLIYGFVPIAYVIVLSFNEAAGKSATTSWNRFTTSNWTNMCEPDGMCASLRLSIEISVISTIIATVLGTLMAFALVRHTFRGRSIANVFIFLPMATPEIVMGSSLLAMFVASGFNGLLGFTTIVIAHVMFCLSFVVVTVKARLAGMDARLEQAAMDLYANEWQTFTRITLPLAAPGILAGALLAFSLSFDDFIVTNFTSGNSVTFPLYIYGAKARGFPAQVFVIGTIMFLVSFVFVIFGQIVTSRRRRAAAR